MTGHEVPAGRMVGLPELPNGDAWADMPAVTALTGYPERTITAWLSRWGPARNPFPRPGVRRGGRLYWRRSALLAWQEAEPITKEDPK